MTKEKLREKWKRDSKRFRERNPNYYVSYLKDYGKKWRDDKKSKGLCQYCGKNKSIDGVTYCVVCRDKNRLRSSTLSFLSSSDAAKAKKDLHKKHIKCSLCGSDKHNGKGWHIDHCHATQRYRGLLCQNCNLGLGQFKDSIQILRKAIIYLDK